MNIMEALGVVLQELNIYINLAIVLHAYPNRGYRHSDSAHALEGFCVCGIYQD